MMDDNRAKGRSNEKGRAKSGSSAVKERMKSRWEMAHGGGILREPGAKCLPLIFLGCAEGAGKNAELSQTKFLTD
jgi:hypothetical protein